MEVPQGNGRYLLYRFRLVHGIAPVKPHGDSQGLVKRPLGRCVGGKVSGSRDHDQPLFFFILQLIVLTDRSFQDLEAVELGVLTEQTLSQRAKERSAVAPTVQIAVDPLPGSVGLLLNVHQVEQILQSGLWAVARFPLPDGIRAGGMLKKRSR